MTRSVESLEVLSFRHGLLQRLHDFALVWLPGFVTYHCLTNYLKETQRLTTTKTICHVTVAVGQGFRCGLAGWFWPRISHGLALKVSIGSVVT